MTPSLESPACRGAHQSLGAPLPVMSLGGHVVLAGAVGDSNGGHQRDARRPRAQGAQDIANAAIINVLSPTFPTPSEPTFSTRARIKKTKPISITIKQFAMKRLRIAPAACMRPEKFGHIKGHGRFFVVCGHTFRV